MSPQVFVNLPAAVPKPAQDLGFMYSRDLDDPDGNSLGFLFMPEQ